MRARGRRGSRRALASLPRLATVTESGLAGSVSRRTTIEMLLDDALVDLFDFYIMTVGLSAKTDGIPSYTCVSGGDSSCMHHHIISVLKLLSS
jgi:hypothetical protein